jgi:hypothetical protein
MNIFALFEAIPYIVLVALALVLLELRYGR